MGARTSKAWLLTPYGVEPFAVAEHTVMEYLSATQPHIVPLTPPHCRAALFWRHRIVPLLDFGAPAGANRATATPKAVVLAYQTQPGVPLTYIAVALREPPVRITVDDETACALPPESEAFWRVPAVSCFSRDGAATPIVNVARLDSAEFRLCMETYDADDDEPFPDAILVTTAPIPVPVAFKEPEATATAAGDNNVHALEGDMEWDADADADDAWDENEGEDVGDADDVFADDADLEMDDDDWMEKDADDSLFDEDEDVDLDADDDDLGEDVDEDIGDADDDFAEFADDADQDDDWADTETSDEDEPALEPL